MASIRRVFFQMTDFINPYLNENILENKGGELFMPNFDIFMKNEKSILCGTKYFAFVNFMLNKNDDANYKYVEFV